MACIFWAMYNAGKVVFVKKLVCCLLIMWMALLSLGANAHAAIQTAPAAAHSHDHALLTTQHHEAEADSLAAVDAKHADTCSHSHCGHGYATGIAAGLYAWVKKNATTTAPATRVSWLSSAVTDNIERPKWPVITPAVVSLLS